MGAEVGNVCVYTEDLHTHTHTHFGWTSVQMGEYWRILLGCWDIGREEGGWISHHKVPPIFKAPVQLKVMVSIPVARLGSSCHHRCIYRQPRFIFCLGRPQICLHRILGGLEMSLLSLAALLEVPSSPASGNRLSSLTVTFGLHSLPASHMKSAIIIIIIITWSLLFLQAISSLMMMMIKELVQEGQVQRSAVEISFDNLSPDAQRPKKTFPIS